MDIFYDVFTFLTYILKISKALITLHVLYKRILTFSNLLLQFTYNTPTFLVLISGILVITLFTSNIIFLYSYVPIFL